MKIYLASKSPRRKELLQQMAVEFEILSIDVPEVLLPNEKPELYSKRVTIEKLKAAWDKIIKSKLTLQPILCADTEVVLDQQILGKPLDYQHAFSMLKSYSGRSHQVITSVGLKYFSFQKVVINRTTVHFAPIPEAEIHKYLSTGDYKDKAGGYGIQSYIGQYINHIEGCFYSVMGLPLNTVRELLVDVQQELD
ncbi:MAG: septum formation protein Maf [Tatlockia sp.]|nr:septum formation protein Maf [Tatlockia sp.]